MTSRTIVSPSEARNLGEWLTGLPFPFTVSVKSGKKRSLDQNALSHKWYAEIAKQQHMTPDEARCECKAWHGIPILLAEDDQFRAFYEEAIKPLDTIEKKLRAMRFIPVTSLMTTEQMARYCDAVFKTYTAQGLRLTIPEDRK